MRLQAQETIDRPRSEVFAYVARDHFRHHQEWDRTVVELTPTTLGGMRVGATATLVRQDGKRRSEGTLEVTEYDPHRSFATISRFGRIVLHTRTDFEPTGDDDTLLVLTVNNEAHGFVRLLLPMMKRNFAQAMKKNLRLIKVAIEANPESG